MIHFKICCLDGNPFLSFAAGKYLPQQALINASGLLQTTSGTSLSTQTALAQAATAAAAASSHMPQQAGNQNQSAITTAAIAAAYGLNQHQQQQQQQHHHQHHLQQQHQQQQQHVSQQNANINGHGQGAPTINGLPASLNGNNIQTHNGAMLLPFLQNLSDDVSFNFSYKFNHIIIII